MKITKRQLKRIIKEEKAKILREFDIDDMGAFPAENRGISPEEELTDTILRIEEIIGEAGVKEILNQMGY